MTGHGFIDTRPLLASAVLDCPECGALLRTVNLEQHLDWHRTRIRRSPDEVLAAFREAYRIADVADPLPRNPVDPGIETQA